MFDHFTVLLSFVLFYFFLVVSGRYKVRTLKVQVRAAFSGLSVLDFSDEIKLSFSICEGRAFAVQTLLLRFVKRRK